MSTLSEYELGVGQLLVEHGAISASQLQDAIDLAARWNAPLRDVMMTRWWIRADVYARAVAAFLDAPYVRLDEYPPDATLLAAHDASLYARRLLIPWRREEGRLRIAAACPDPETVAFIRARWGDNVDLLITSKDDVVAAVQRAFGPQISHAAVHDLAETDPEVSARRVITRSQGLFLYGLFTLFALGLAFWPLATLVTINGFVTLFFVGGLLFKLALVKAGGLGLSDTSRAVESEMRVMTDADLPTFSILVPMFREPDVLPILARALRELDYPLSKLDIKIVLEESDHVTIAAARALELESVFEIIVVPPSHPQTKPKACNYALKFARGEFLVIYDAEDKPERDQLRKVVAAFRRSPPNTACIQCRLNYFNARENWLTRMFTLEYALWFDLMLPGLQKLGAPIPLGGTSNHFRIAVLRELHAWDPFNVTEDADLGIRLSQKGYRVGVIDSTTYEEANCGVDNWIRQRSRWVKGYMQTFLVHARRPIQLARTIGPLGMTSFIFFVGGTALSGILHPVCWAMFLLWIVGLSAGLDALFPPVLLYLSLFNLIVGNGLYVYMMMLAPMRRRWSGLAPWAASALGYWTLLSIAAYKGLYQLIFNPFHWEKTNHGLSSMTVTQVASARAADLAERGAAALPAEALS